MKSKKLSEIAAESGYWPQSIRAVAKRLGLGSGRPLRLTEREAAKVIAALSRGPGNPNFQKPGQAKKIGKRGGRPRSK